MGKKVILTTPKLHDKLKLAVKLLRKSARWDSVKLNRLKRLASQKPLGEAETIIENEIKEMRDLANYLEDVARRMNVKNDNKILLQQSYS